MCVVVFVAQTQLINTFMEIRFDPPLSASHERDIGAACAAFNQHGYFNNFSPKAKAGIWP